MKTTVATEDLQRFGELVGRRLGLRLPWRPEGWLADLISNQAAYHHHESARTYLDHLDTDLDPAEADWLMQQFTVGESYFFRDPGQLRVFADVVVPRRMRAQVGSRGLRILSAGCASGEEPYTLAMLCREAVPEPEGVSILGVDVSRSRLAKATDGRYSAWALRATPPELRDRWFRPDGTDWVLDQQIRRSVVFGEHNLVRDDANVWAPAGYDAIFCRNVLMYFTAESGDVLLARLAASLAPGGFLFLGQAETLRGFTPDLQPRTTRTSVYFEHIGQ